jgi:GTP-binding protein
VFIDRLRIHVRAGDGGAGVVSFRKQKGRPRGKPEGGSGGRGGDVYLEAEADMVSLLTYQRRPHHRAASGTHGEGDLRHGRNGEDLVLPVPLGTVVREPDGTLVADLVESGQRVKVASGGRGGRGNAAFVSAARKAPSFAEQGEYGEERTYGLEIKLIADAALIGYPNAGKSTLISRVSAAKPKIADYPFTTLQPHLGVVEVDGRQFVLADIPGLIEGAADGKGLGHEFLRHVERARVLVVLVDPSPLQTDPPGRQLDVLIGELAAHLAELAERPRLVALAKADLPEAAGVRAELQEQHGVAPPQPYVVSAVTGEGLTPLLHAVADRVEEATRAAPDREGFILHRPAPPGFEIAGGSGSWVVSGRSAERAVALADLTVVEAADFAATRLKRLGVDEALLAAGARPGDEVRIGDLVFEFVPDDVDDVADVLDDADRAS